MSYRWPRRTSHRAAAITVLSAAVVGFTTVQWLGRTSGASRGERRRRMPGDETIPDPSMVTTHAATIDAPPSAVWPWLIQMGWHQGGWYTERWVDRLLFPANEAAADHLIPELQQRVVGDFIPDGPPESGCGFRIEVADVDRALVLRSTSHLPAAWRTRFSAELDWTWSFQLDDLGNRRTRLAFRTRCVARPWWVLIAYKAALIPADFVMSRQMLRGITRRAEHLAAEQAARRAARS